jgi:hypothetical protein
LAVRRRQQERRRAVPVRRARLGSRTQQVGDQTGVAGACRPVQRRRAVDFRRVDVGALRDQRSHRRGVADACRLRHARITGSGVDGHRKDRGREKADGCGPLHRSIRPVL